jgi:hypothetical protein
MPARDSGAVAVHGLRLENGGNLVLVENMFALEHRGTVLSFSIVKSRQR